MQDSSRAAGVFVFSLLRKLLLYMPRVVVIIRGVRFSRLFEVMSFYRWCVRVDSLIRLMRQIASFAASGSHSRVTQRVNRGR